MRPALTCLLATVAFLAARLASPAEKPLELAQIFGPTAVSLERRPAIQWLAGGDAYSTLEPSRMIDGGIDVVRYETASGKRSIAVQAEGLIPAGAAKPIVATDHHWSPNYQVLLLKAAAGDYWLFDLRRKALRQLGRQLPQPALLHPEFSPDSSRVAYVAANDLHVETVNGSQALKLTDDGSDLILNARGDLAYEEEFALSKAFKWSPDSRRIAYWQFDTSGVGTFYMIRNTDGQYSKPVPLRYPKPGTTNSAVKVGVVSAAAPGTTWFALSGDPRDNYVPRLDWTDNSNELLIQYENRLQNTNQILIGDAATGAVLQIMIEHDDSWLIPSDEVTWLNGGRAFTWLSERDGWMHLYVVSRDGKRVELRTPGNFDVISIQAVDDRAGYAYFIAAPDDVTRRYLYRASLQGQVKLERLTPAGAAGSHDHYIAPGAKWAFHTFSTADTPPVVDVVRIPTHEPKRTIISNPKMRSLVQATPHVPTEFFKVDIGSTVLDAWMMKPPNFDAAKKYPLLMYVYSEPAGQTVIDRWGGDRYLWHVMLAQRGYLVASVDSRGAAPHAAAIGAARFIGRSEFRPQPTRPPRSNR